MNSLATASAPAASTAPLLAVEELNAWYAESKVLHGMNFDVMPELHWRWGYPAVMAVMLLIVIGLLLFFRRRRWI